MKNEVFLNRAICKCVSALEWVFRV